MSVAVKVSDELISQAKTRAKVFHRSTAGQIEFWAKIGQVVEDNRDLPYSFIEETLIGLEEAKAGYVEPYQFTVKGKQ